MEYLCGAPWFEKAGESTCFYQRIAELVLSGLTAFYDGADVPTVKVPSTGNFTGNGSNRETIRAHFFFFLPDALQT